MPRPRATLLAVGHNARVKRLQFWGWGYEDEGPDDAARARLAKGLGERFGRPDLAPAPYRGSTRSSCRRRACARPPRWPRSLSRRAVGARAPRARAQLPRRRARAAARLPHAARLGRVPDERGGGRRRARLLRARAARGGAVRRRLERGGRRRDRDRRRLPRRGHARPRRGWTACSRSTAPRAPRASRPACSGPALEDQLRPHGLTLRHYPQSFEFSSLGGWIATRSGGHFATHYTHIDEFVEALRVVTPTGVVATRRLPGSGAGPVARPLLHRLGGHARRSSPRRGCACRIARPGARTRACASRSFAAGGRARCARCQPVGARARELPAARPGRGRELGGRLGGGVDPGARLRVGRPRARRLDARAPSSCAATTAASVPDDALRTRTRRGRDARGRAPAPGATRSSTRPTCATRWSRSACSPRPSRPRSPGTASSACTRA